MTTWAEFVGDSIEVDVREDKPVAGRYTWTSFGTLEAVIGDVLHFARPDEKFRHIIRRWTVDCRKVEGEPRRVDPA